jgi:SAM-dependent methyltransferase
MKRTSLLIPNASPVVDIGCGSGLISQLIPNSVVYVGIDFNPNYLAHDWKGRRVDGRVGGDILGLPFQNEAFRTVLLLHVIEHFPPEKQVTLLKEAYRVLARNGTFIISTPNLDTLRNADKFLPPNNPKHYHCLHKRELETLLIKAGFGNIRRHGFDIVIEFPNKYFQLIPETFRRRAAHFMPKLEKHLIFQAEKL